MYTNTMMPFIYFVIVIAEWVILLSMITILTPVARLARFLLSFSRSSGGKHVTRTLHVVCCVLFGLSVYTYLHSTALHDLKASGAAMNVILAESALQRNSELECLMLGTIVLLAAVINRVHKRLTELEDLKHKFRILEEKLQASEKID